MLHLRRAVPRASALLSTRALSTSPPKKDTVRALAKRVALKGEVVLVRADLSARRCDSFKLGRATAQSLRIRGRGRRDR